MSSLWPNNLFKKKIFDIQQNGILMLCCIWLEGENMLHLNPLSRIQKINMSLCMKWPSMSMSISSKSAYDPGSRPHLAICPPQIRPWWIGRKIIHSQFHKGNGGGSECREGRYRRPQWASTKAPVPITGPSAAPYQHSFCGARIRQQRGHNVPIHHQYSMLIM